jgi:hypothetical protein
MRKNILWAPFIILVLVGVFSIFLSDTNTVTEDQVNIEEADEVHDYTDEEKTEEVDYAAKAAQAQEERLKAWNAKDREASENQYDYGKTTEEKAEYILENIEDEEDPCIENPQASYCQPFDGDMTEELDQLFQDMQESDY